MLHWLWCMIRCVVFHVCLEVLALNFLEFLDFLEFLETFM